MKIFSQFIWMESLTWGRYHTCKISVAGPFPQVIADVT
ncbi:uncharacterized protein METZ01_LOCUS449655 [marine metagenome]|uniref:Uncharacterized protein n=1 Tax=marine metagenome TaxID=408172 RepID=A0A382ZMW6_9ZZZZ